MSRPANKQRSIRITVTTTEPVKHYLESLVQLGAHGSTPSEVALTIILEAMRRDMAKVRSTTLNSAPPQIIWANPP